LSLENIKKDDKPHKTNEEKLFSEMNDIFRETCRIMAQTNKESAEKIKSVSCLQNDIQANSAYVVDSGLKIETLVKKIDVIESKIDSMSVSVNRVSKFLNDFDGTVNMFNRLQSAIKFFGKIAAIIIFIISITSLPIAFYIAKKTLNTIEAIDKKVPNEKYID
jgi:hypothetical protein